MSKNLKSIVPVVTAITNIAKYAENGSFEKWFGEGGKGDKTLWTGTLRSAGIYTVEDCANAFKGHPKGDIAFAAVQQWGFVTHHHLQDSKGQQHTASCFIYWIADKGHEYTKAANYGMARSFAIRLCMALREKFSPALTSDGRDLEQAIRENTLEAKLYHTSSLTDKATYRGRMWSAWKQLDAEVARLVVEPTCSCGRFTPVAETPVEGVEAPIDSETGEIAIEDDDLANIRLIEGLLADVSLKLMSEGKKVNKTNLIKELHGKKDQTPYEAAGRVLVERDMAVIDAVNAFRAAN